MPSQRRAGGRSRAARSGTGDAPERDWASGSSVRASSRMVGADGKPTVLLDHVHGRERASAHPRRDTTGRPPRSRRRAPDRRSAPAPGGRRAGRPHRAPARAPRAGPRSASRPADGRLPGSEPRIDQAEPRHDARARAMLARATSSRTSPSADARSRPDRRRVHPASSASQSRRPPASRAATEPSGAITTS